MESVSHNLNSRLEEWIGPRDPRVRGWPLMDSYLPTFGLSVLYLAAVWAGPRLMRRRTPFSCRGVLLLYNLSLTLLSLHMFTELLPAVGRYSLFCQDIDTSPETDEKVMRTLWWYYFSKLIEFMDTFFFIVRKNNHQISFLHIYHHTTMFNIWWFVLNWIPCGHSFFGPMLNSLVHVLMYSYYGLSSIPALRPLLWWKKYITQLQLIQFFLTVGHSVSALLFPCGFPKGWTCFLISYMFSLIALFSNFYFQTYTKLKASSTETNGSNGIKLSGKLRQD